MRRLFVLIFLVSTSLLHALERQPLSVYHARREALGAKLNGGIALIFADNEPNLEYQEFRQDEDFYYLTGWNEPGGALLIQGPASAVGTQPARGYRETLLFPTRNLRMELYTGVKLDASNPKAPGITGVDHAAQMTDLPAIFSQLFAKDRRVIFSVYSQLDVPQSKPALDFIAATLGQDSAPVFSDVRALTAQLRAVKDPGEVDLIRKATDASMTAQRAMMQAVHPGASERAIAGLLDYVQMQGGCERPSYPPIVGSGVNSTVLHYSADDHTMKDGDVVVVDAACEYSMYASDITRTMPVNGRFSDRQREIYNIVLGAQKAAMDAFVAGKSRENDPQHRYPDSLDTIAWKYMNEHGKDLHGQPLGKYFIHGIGHLVGIDVHDPYDYSKPLEKGMVFTIEPGIYIPEEKIGVRIEDIYYADPNGKLVRLTESLPHTAEDVEAAMRKQ